MAFLHIVSQDVFRMVVEFLDFDSIALLLWTFDKRIQRALVDGAVKRITFSECSPRQLYSPHSYLLSCLRCIDTLVLDSPFLKSDDHLTPDSNLAPRHLEMDLSFLWGRPSLKDAAFLQYLRTLHVSMATDALPTFVNCLPLLPPSIERLRLTFVPPRFTVLMNMNLQELIELLPKTLLELSLKATAYTTSTLPLPLTFNALPCLEVLSISGIECSSTEFTKFKLPNTLTSLAVTSSAVLSQASFADSNLLTFELDAPPWIKSPQFTLFYATNDQIALQQLLPPCLVQLRIPSLACMLNLPLQLTSLEVECTDTESLGVLLKRLLLPIATLHTLSVLLPEQPWSDPGCVARLPSSITDLHITVRKDAPSPDLIARIFGTSHVRLELAMPSFPFSILLDFVRHFPHAKIKVTPCIALTDEEVSQILDDVPEVTAMLQEYYEPKRLSVAIVKWLEKLGNGRIEMKLCECRSCVAQWKLEHTTAKQITLPVIALDVWGALPRKHRILPPTLEVLRFKVSQLNAHHMNYSYPLNPTDLLNTLSASSKLSVLDFDTTPIYPSPQFWASIPRTVTQLRSTLEYDPQSKFGGRCKCATWPSEFASFSFAPLDIITLETPYLLYSVNHLQLLFSSSTIRTLSATIKDEDVKIFEFGLCPTGAFPHLQNMTLRAIPTVTGMLIGNYHTNISLKYLENEVIEVLQTVDVVTADFVYVDTLAIHPRATHVLLQEDSQGPAFSRLEYHRGDLLREIRGLLVAVQHDAAYFPPNLLSLKFAVQHPLQLKFLVLPLLPTCCPHVQISYDPRYAGSQPSLLPHLVLPKLPSSLENVVMTDSLPAWTNGNEVKNTSDFLQVEVQPPLPQLRCFKTDYAEDRFLDALCRALTKTARVSVGTAIFTGLLLPSDMTHFSWKSAIALCLDLEKRFPQLEIGKWRTCGWNLAIESEQVTSVSFGLDFAIESLFEETTIHRKASIMPLIEDVIFEQERETLPVALPPSVTRLEFSVSRLCFQDEDLSDATKRSPKLLRSHKLFQPKAKMPLPNVKHLTLRPAALPKSSALHCTSLPPNLEVLNIAPTGTLHTAKTLHLKHVQEATPHLREVNATPMIQIGELEDDVKDKLTINTVQEVE